MGLQLLQNALGGATFGYGMDLLEISSKEKVEEFTKVQETSNSDNDVLASKRYQNLNQLGSDIFVKKCLQVGAAAVNVGVFLSSSLRAPLLEKSIRFFSNPFLLVPGIAAIALCVIANQIVKETPIFQKHIVNNADKIQVIAHSVMIVSSFAIAYFSSSNAALSFGVSLTLGMLNDKVVPTSMKKHVDWARFACAEIYLVTLSNISLLFPLAAAALLGRVVYQGMREEKTV